MILSNEQWCHSMPIACRNRPEVLYKQAKVALDSYVNEQAPP